LDGKTRVRGLWGGYTPKLYDSRFLKLHEDEFNQKFYGATFIADSHYQEGKKIFPNITWHVNIHKPPKKKGSNEGEILCKKHNVYNQQHQQARARVESPNGIFKTMFKSLSAPWMEDELQQDYLFKIACAIQNIQLK